MPIAPKRIAYRGARITTGVHRFTLGFWERSEGIQFIPVMIGLFASSEFLTQAMNLDRPQVRAALDAVKLPTGADFKKVWETILRSCGIGTFIGVLPAEGGTVAALIGDNEAKRWSKTPEKFVTGEIEGIAGILVFFVLTAISIAAPLIASWRRSCAS